MKKITENGTVHTYYFHKDGKVHKGWLTYKGKKYYFYKGKTEKSGRRAENVRLTSSNGIISVFDKSGVCIDQYKKEWAENKQDPDEGLHLVRIFLKEGKSYEKNM